MAIMGAYEAEAVIIADNGSHTFRENPDVPVLSRDGYTPCVDIKEAALAVHRAENGMTVTLRNFWKPIRKTTRL